MNDPTSSYLRVNPLKFRFDVKTTQAIYRLNALKVCVSAHLLITIELIQAPYCVKNPKNIPIFLSFNHLESLALLLLNKQAMYQKFQNIRNEGKHYEKKLQKSKERHSNWPSAIEHGFWLVCTREFIG